MTLSSDEQEQISVQTDSVPTYLGDLLARSINGLNREQAGKISSLLRTYSDVFSKGPHDIGRAKGTLHKINTGDARPTKQTPRRPPVTKREETANTIKEMVM